MPSNDTGSSFPLLRAILATSLALAVALGCAVIGAFLLMVILNGFSERQAIPIFALFAALFAGGTALLVAGVNLLALGKGPDGSRRFGASLALGGVTGGLLLVVTLGFLAMF